MLDELQLQKRPSGSVLLGALLLCGVLRLLWASHFPLIGAEAYYWEWSQHLAWGYFDHPPMVAGLIRLSTWLGNDSVLFVRLPAVILSLLTTLVVYALAKDMFGEMVALATAGLLQIMPFFTAVGAVMVPDVPLLFFWILTVYLVYRATNGGDPRWWYLAGITLGLCLLSKYHAVLLVPSTLLYLLSSPDMRKWFFRKEPYLAAVIALLVFSPNIAWNLARGLQTFTFLLVERHDDTGLSPAYFPKFIGGILLLLSPFVALLMAYCVPAMFRSAKNDQRYALLFSTSLFPIVFFGVLSPWVSIGAHWPAVGYVLLTLLFVAHAAESNLLALGHRLRRASLFSFGFCFVLVATLYIAPLVVERIPPLEYRKSSEISKGIFKFREEIVGWEALGVEVNKAIAKMPDPEHTFVITNSYRQASFIRFLTGSRYPTLVTGRTPQHQYSIWEDPVDLNGWDAVFVDKRESPKDLLALEDLFAQASPAETIRLTKDGMFLRSFSFRYCYDAKRPVREDAKTASAGHDEAMQR